MDQEAKYVADTEKTVSYSADANYEAVEVNGQKTLVGYAVVWGAQTDQPIAGMRHRFTKGAIDFQQPTYALFHHSYAQPLADTASNTLRLRHDIHGVRVEIDLPNTTAGNDTFELVKSGRVKGMSFAGQIKSAISTEPGIL